jgi:hypothetical protein
LLNISNGLTIARAYNLFKENKTILSADEWSTLAKSIERGCLSGPRILTLHYLNRPDQRVYKTNINEKLQAKNLIGQQ